MTDVNEIAKLVGQYQSWVKDKTTLKSVHTDWVEVSTPFLDRHNDYIQLYVKKVSGGYIISDDGIINQQSPWIFLIQHKKSALSLSAMLVFLFNPFPNTSQYRAFPVPIT